MERWKGGLDRAIQYKLYSMLALAKMYLLYSKCGLCRRGTHDKKERISVM